MTYSASAYPYDTVVRITDTIGSQSWQGSGVLISPDEVLTASHVVYIQGVGTANEIVVTPGYNDGSSPYGSADGTYIHYFPINDANRSITNQQSQSDYAIIHLATPFTSAGFMGLESNFSGGPVNITGYPASAGGAQVESTQTDTLDPRYTLLDGSALGEGSSGGPLWIEAAGGPSVVGLVSSESDTNSTGYNTLITTAAFDQIEAWIKEDDSGSGTPPTSPPVTPANEVILRGSSSQYLIADGNGSLYVQDTVSGRDGTQTLPGVTEMVFADGIGVFDPTGTAEDVARVYLATLGRAPDVAGLEYWTAQIDDSHVPLNQVASSFTTSPEFIQDYGSLSNTAFVNQLYVNVLGRPADAGGASYWDGVLASGATRGTVVLGFAESKENEANTLSTGGDENNAEAYRLYQAALNRAPDATGLSFWSSALASGATPTQVAENFINSAEFQQDYGLLTRSAFVSTLYQNVLNRAPDALGLQYWTTAMAQGTSEASVLVGFSDSLENRTQTASATHANWVFIPS
jgi:V8-like Glu-specific endopeptidase